jgi:hypothetical protein
MTVWREDQRLCWAIDFGAQNTFGRGSTWLRYVVIRLCRVEGARKVDVFLPASWFS